jgi:hypothetical protein
MIDFDFNFLFFSGSVILFFVLFAFCFIIYHNIFKKTIDSVFPVENFLINEKGIWIKKKFRTDGNLIITASLFSLLVGNFRIRGFDLQNYEILFLKQKGKLVKFYKGVLNNDLILPFFIGEDLSPFNFLINTYIHEIKSIMNFSEMSKDFKSLSFQYIPIFIMFTILGVLLFFGMGHIEEMKKLNMDYNIDVLNQMISISNSQNLTDIPLIFTNTTKNENTTNSPSPYPTINHYKNVSTEGI